MNGYQRSTEAVFTERSVLRLAVLVAVFQVVEQCLAEHALALAVDEHDFLSLVAEISVHHAMEFSQLHVEHVAVG